VGYSPERKAAVLKLMLAPHNMAIRQLSQEEGISEGTLHKWRAEARGKGQLLPDADAGPEGWSSRDKFAAVLETAALDEADLAEYCRKRGLYPAQIAAWQTTTLTNTRLTPRHSERCRGSSSVTDELGLRNISAKHLFVAIFAFGRQSQPRFLRYARTFGASQNR